MDAGVSVDISVTHLAGAVNKPLPFLLPFTPDWRWILERSDAPWYPRATLYRQTVPADLPSVIVRVRAGLAASG